MMTLTFLAFVLLGISILSVWFNRDPKVWGGFLILSLLASLYTGHIYWQGLLITAGWAALWFYYAEHKDPQARIFLFTALVFLSFGFKLHLFPGFNPVTITPRFHLGLSGPLVGLFPLALLVPLAATRGDWKLVFTKGLGYSLAGVAILAILAVLTGATSWHYKIPTNASLRFLTNLVLVAIPEEAFYRGFMQHELCRFLPDTKNGRYLAIFITSILFSAVHIYWSPSLAIMGFVFLASILYGWVYMVTKKVECAVLCHFLLNFIHMTFFSYHAM